MKFIFYILSAILLFSCGDSPLTQEELEAAADANDSRTRIKMDMDDDLNLTLSVVNFSEQLNFLSFTLVYDYNIFDHSTPNAGKFTINFSSEDFEVESEYMSFNFSGVSGSGDLLKIQFSSSSYNGTTIYLQDLLMIDSNNQELEYDSDTFYAEQICYIDKHPTNGDDYGDYKWMNQFCFPIQTDWRDN